MDTQFFCFFNHADWLNFEKKARENSNLCVLITYLIDKNLFVQFTVVLVFFVPSPLAMAANFIVHSRTSRSTRNQKWAFSSFVHMLVSLFGWSTSWSSSSTSRYIHSYIGNVANFFFYIEHIYKLWWLGKFFVVMWSTYTFRSWHCFIKTALVCNDMKSVACIRRHRQSTNYWGLCATKWQQCSSATILRTDRNNQFSFCIGGWFVIVLYRNPK